MMKTSTTTVETTMKRTLRALRWNEFRVDVCFASEQAEATKQQSQIGTVDALLSKWKNEKEGGQRHAKRVEWGD